MVTSTSEEFPLARELDVVSVRRATREAMSTMGFGVVDLTKMVTAVSELARNVLDHGGGGLVRMERLTDGGRVGMRLAFVDKGPGIADVALAISDGYSSGDGLGLGLGGSRRLVNEFEIVSSPECGTTVTITRWR